MAVQHEYLTNEDVDMNELNEIITRNGFKKVHGWMADAVAGLVEQTVEDSLEAGRPIFPPEIAG
jgi:hypothetical protein